MGSPVTPKAPPARFNNVHTVDEYALPPPVGQCQCCGTHSKSRSGQLLIQEQQINMADSIRKPRGGGKDPHDDPSDDSSFNSTKDNGKGKQRDPVDDGGDEGGSSSQEDRNGRLRRRRRDDEDWKFDSRLLKPPKAYDGSDLTYFQPWLEMLKSEMMSKWMPWGSILKVLEEAGERRLIQTPLKFLTSSRRARPKDPLNRSRMSSSEY